MSKEIIEHFFIKNSKYESVLKFICFEELAAHFWAICANFRNAQFKICRPKFISI